MINGAVSRRDFLNVACVRRNRCKTCDGPGAEKTDSTNLKAGEMLGCKWRTRFGSLIRRRK